ncbi:hypothetical protein [Burkholderia ubonensis]|uniref:hypothetical protein n=1 Tax=Burkholderia ubonensis TaxID=101571 RepID=UPI0012F9D723|nr:hypothetical protein [Burkholderia ubonensis]
MNKRTPTIEENMRLAELFEPQKPTPKKKKSDTVAQVLIIESLELIDEAKERREGAVLASVLRMCGKNPLYYYIRTKKELEHLADEFEASGYRYLHISCHGGATSLETTLESVSYQDFAKIFAGKLKNRRLFVSACSAGNEMFAEMVGSRNDDVISIAAPSTDIRFDHAVAFWTSLYVKTFSLNSNSMNSARIIEVARPLVALFSAPLHFSRRKKTAWVHEVIDGKA